MSSSDLFQPLKISPRLTLPNRIVVGPMTRNRAVQGPNFAVDDGHTIPGDVMREWYAQRARGGAGLIITEGALVTRQGTQWQNAPGLWSDAHAEGWKKIVRAVHAEGVPIFAQLWHVGRLSHPEMKEQQRAGVPVYAPSAIKARGGRFTVLPSKPGFVVPTAISDPRILIEHYRTAALYAKKAGFDGVELHGAYGYLIGQFLDTSSNVRTDQYGGSARNRIRFAVEALEAAIDAFDGDAKRVAVKLVPVGGGNDSGMPEADTRETYSLLLRECERLGLAYVQMLRGTDEFPLPADRARATFYDDVGHFLSELPTVPLFLNGTLSPSEASQLISNGTISAAVFSTSWINNPDFANRVRESKPLNTVPIQWQKMYTWDGHPSEGYTDYRPVGGFVKRVRHNEHTL